MFKSQTEIREVKGMIRNIQCVKGVSVASCMGRQGVAEPEWGGQLAFLMQINQNHTS